ncbi:MAG: BlaI/MecI/CopY family transcriptional regulator [Lachnospiraceae bacterium]|nr:BlaI/MecI/CopY family transcriptional regulator [Lachnospiraceae bacterium]
MIKLTNSEAEVMELLWASDEPLSPREIIEQSTDKTWKDSYIHLIINSLLKKNMIEVAGLKQTTKNYTRIFTPTMSKKQWLLSQITDNQSSDDMIRCLFDEILKQIDNQQELDRLSDYLDKRKKRTR